MFKMAFRNIFRQKRRSLLTGLTMLGGFILTAVVIGFSDGSFNGIVNAFTRNRLGHIQIHAPGYLSRPSLNKVIRGYRDIGGKIEAAPDAEAWTPRVYSAGLVSVGERTEAARIIGIDPVREVAATRFDKKVTSGRSFSTGAEKEIILGAGLARSLRASLGDDVVLVTQAADGSLADERYRVIGLVDSGDMAADRTMLYLRLDDSRSLLVLDDEVHEIIVIARSLNRVTALDGALHRSLAAFQLDIEPWQEFAKVFYQSMQADKRGHSVLLLVLFIVVAIGVLNTALMSVLERRREYGVLKALGTRPRQVFSLVVLEILCLAVISIAVGAGLSLPINIYLSHHQFPLTGLFSKPLTFGGMSWAGFTSEINVRSFLIPAVTVLVSAFLISLMPAFKAARTEPARSIRIF
jgi:ABC-type lipoprotein release transport system permease subunit